MPDLSDPSVFSAHMAILEYVANNIILAPQRRKFEIDENNSEVIRFLMYYFNNCELAEQVFPKRGYKLHKNILLQGGVGVGKTMLMQIFSEYLKRTNNPRYFFNVSVTQMVNYYSINNNIDRFLYNEREGEGYQGSPVNLCLNDIGVDNRPFYGIDTFDNRSMTFSMPEMRYGRVANTTADLLISPPIWQMSSLKRSSGKKMNTVVSLTASKLIM